MLALVCRTILSAGSAVVLLLLIVESVEAKSLEGYELSLEHSLWGAEQILVSDRGIKLVFLRHSFSGYLTEPDWRLHFYSDRRKMFCESDPRNRFGERLPDTTQVPVRQIALRGLPVSKYTMRVHRPFNGSVFDDYMPQLSDVHRDRKRYQKTLFVVKEEVSCLPEKHLPKQARMILKKMYGVAGLPVQYQITLSDGQTITKIKFTGWKKANISPLAFIPPKGYKRVKSVSDIVNTGLSSQVEEFSKQWGSGP